METEIAVKKSTLYKIAGGLLVLAALICIPAYFWGIQKYQDGYSAGFSAGQDSIECGGGSHVSNPWKTEK